MGLFVFEKHKLLLAFAFLDPFAMLLGLFYFGSRTVGHDTYSVSDPLTEMWTL